ncbi:MAG: demethylmenaquinone methyltransferase [Streptosporangiaceae bacterium]
MSRATLEKRPREVAAMFDRVATRYDVTNDVLSLGQDRLWRRAVGRAVAPRAGDRILDVAAGTGTSTTALARPSVTCVACDFSLGMLRVGARRRGRGGRRGFVAGDAMRLPFRAGAFDAVTISFGLRNVADVSRALAEMRRVVRPGGRLVVCEFSRPSRWLFRTVYDVYLTHGLPRVARLVASDPDAYRYLTDSIQAWPDQGGLAALMHAAGWERVSWRDLSGGVVALHVAHRPL